MKKFIVLFIACFFTLPIFALPYDFDFWVKPTYTLQNGVLNEFVIARDSKNNIYTLSQLNWSVQNISYLGGQTGLEWKYIGVVAGISGAISSKSGNMEDYDWLNSSNTSMCTTKSISENTLNTGFHLDISIKEKINPFLNFIINPVVGFSYDEKTFSGRNAYGWYGSETKPMVSYDDPKAIVKEKGTLLGIDYNRNTWNVYFGTSFGYSFFNKKLTLLTSVYASPYTYVESLDFHHSDKNGSTGTYYYDKMTGYFKKWIFGGSVEYNIWKGLSVDTVFDFHFLNKMNGITYASTSKQTLKNNLSYTTSACAGYWWNLSVGLKWTF